MPTDKQLNFLRNLYFELGQEPEDDIENLTVAEASERIRELKAMKDKRDTQGDYRAGGARKKTSGKEYSK